MKRDIDTLVSAIIPEGMIRAGLAKMAPERRLEMLRRLASEEIERVQAETHARPVEVRDE